VQLLEKEGIGRPNKYAATIATLENRNYVRKQSNALIPTFTGFAVTQFMESRFGDLVDVGFTSQMEEHLDNIAAGKTEWLPYLRAFYAGPGGLAEKVKEETARKDEANVKAIVLPQIPDAQVYVGKFGAYIEGFHPQNHTRTKASLPENVTPSDLTKESVEEMFLAGQQGPTTLGTDPATGECIYLQKGAYGPYLQIGEGADPKIKPKRASIPKNVPLEMLNLEKALAILALPRLLGEDPTTHQEIRAGLGRFGPYVVHQGEFRSLKEGDDVLTVTLSRALELFAEPKGGRMGAALLKTLGTHPKDGKPVTLHKGKFGIYIKHEKINATLPKELSPDTVTLEQALELLAQKKAKKK
jgi:DNA topoisomerase-1